MVSSQDIGMIFALKTVSGTAEVFLLPLALNITDDEEKKLRRFYVGVFRRVKPALSQFPIAFNGFPEFVSRLTTNDKRVLGFLVMFASQLGQVPGFVEAALPALPYLEKLQHEIEDKAFSDFFTAVNNAACY
jgi:hypothetical protein